MLLPARSPPGLELSQKVPWLLTPIPVQLLYLRHSLCFITCLGVKQGHAVAEPEGHIAAGREQLSSSVLAPGSPWKLIKCLRMGILTFWGFLFVEQTKLSLLVVPGVPGEGISFLGPLVFLLVGVSQLIAAAASARPTLGCLSLFSCETDFCAVE